MMMSWKIATSSNLSSFFMFSYVKQDSRELVSTCNT